jgi:hypothetical protein
VRRFNGDAPISVNFMDWNGIDLNFTERQQRGLINLYGKRFFKNNYRE